MCTQKHETMEFKQEQLTKSLTKTTKCRWEVLRHRCYFFLCNSKALRAASDATRTGSNNSNCPLDAAAGSGATLGTLVIASSYYIPSFVAKVVLILCADARSYTYSTIFIRQDDAVLVNIA